MDWLLDFIREVCLVLWVGGLVAIDLVETPIRFSTPGISKQQATAIGSRLFSRFGCIQAFLGVALLLDSVAILRGLKTTTTLDRTVVACTAAMLLAALLQSVWITPRILAKMPSLEDSEHNMGAVTSFRRAHWVFVGLDILKMILGFTVLLALAYGRRIG